MEISFTAASVRLRLPGVAEGLRAGGHSGKTIHDALREAHEQGARMLVCSDALRAQGLAGQPLIPECASFGGAVQFMARALDLRWRTLLF